MATNDIDPDWDGQNGLGPEPGQDRPDAPRREASRPGVGVLADRIAAALVHHEPGWRLPRHTTLARRYNVTTAEIDAAVTELTTRHLIRRLADGQLYRISPAEYLIPIEGLPGLASRVDPMGGHIACRSRQAAWRQVPEDIGWALRIPHTEPVAVIRVHWTANGEPAAFSTTYLLKEIAAPFMGPQDTDALARLTLLAVAAPAGASDDVDSRPLGEPRAVHIEMQPPPASVARSLHLSAGQPAAMVTARFDDPVAGRPVALSISVFRPDLFRIVLMSGEHPLAGGDDRTSAGAWTRAVEDWEP
ncbi:MAG TPA: GntR family transcriptional regulator [Streptosporangiaceae bacterium]|jgi:DNA-binding GntR family transcriptional regulator